MTEPTLVDPGPATTPGRNRTALIAGGGIAALVLVLLGIKLTSSGGSTTTTTTPAVGSSAARVTTTTTTTGQPAETFEVFSTKNPFVALRGQAVGGGGSTSGTTTGTTSGSSGSTTPGGSAAGASGGGAGSTAPAPSSSRVSVLDMFTEQGRATANVKVNDTVYKVVAGQTFATTFKAVSLSVSSGCGDFLFGDEPFRLCKGQQVLK